MKSAKAKKVFDIEQIEALSRSNNLEISSLLCKYDSHRKKPRKKLSARRLLTSGTKSQKRRLSPTYTSETGLVSSLTTKIEELNEEINEKNYTIRELTAEVFNLKNNFNDLRYKYEKSQDKKKLLKQYLKDKVESLIEAEDSLANANDIIQDLSQKCEDANYDRDKIEQTYHKDFENIVDTLTSMKVYDKDTIESDSLMEVISRSLQEIKAENKMVRQLKADNLKLPQYRREIEKLKAQNRALEVKIQDIKSTTDNNRLKKQMFYLVKSKADSYKSELGFLKSSFKSELSILKSNMETTINNIVLKSKEIMVNNEFAKEEQFLKYKSKVMSQYGVNIKQKSEESQKETEDLVRLIETLSTEKIFLKSTISSLEFQLEALQKQSQEQLALLSQLEKKSAKEDDKDLVGILKNEFEEKLTQYKKLTEKKLQKIQDDYNDKENRQNRENCYQQFEKMMDVDLEELGKDNNSNQNYLPKSYTEDSNKTIFMYIKDNSLLKQTNYFLEKEKKSLEKELQACEEKNTRYEQKISNLESKVQDQEAEISRYRYGETLVQSKFDNANSDLNSSMPYAFNYTVKQQKEESFRMSRDELKSLSSLLRETQKKRRGRSGMRGRNE
ncbi:unnamed protein product [Moneuplotes crassus]|uniref:Uncharacterized protein n=1 Tax=Euplotes crassus TaxID=5936 RepID=A0AAD1U7G8_EUPCR|nr:unnamed protein product [Moneuplotes crassus]